MRQEHQTEIGGVAAIEREAGGSVKSFRAASGHRISVRVDEDDNLSIWDLDVEASSTKLLSLFVRGTWSSLHIDPGALGSPPPVTEKPFIKG